MPQAFDEYVKAWFACKVLAKEYGLGLSLIHIFALLGALYSQKCFL